MASSSFFTREVESRLDMWSRYTILRKIVIKLKENISIYMYNIWRGLILRLKRVPGWDGGGLIAEGALTRIDNMVMYMYL